MTATTLAKRFAALKAQAEVAATTVIILAVATPEAVIPVVAAIQAVAGILEEAILEGDIRAVVIPVVAEAVAEILVKTSKIIQKWNRFFACPVRSVST